ncbi:Lrp/AsnC family transcriptional regulator [Mucilaginibacter sp. FT3.2]|uniref:Lrp/AsnC family transcriptional regulator n=1 Tax=Mucilaginibacter sp. FT3.2 TaxID=2723090 RepID=UPI00161AD46D|nr:Lrp/AsnC family transcriptional regulator [Mucilaginibacter sp. FT3.2]MBB6231537.1 DNA-binding Lrp family transcriptional regulator [Mucilaginibacter sp. FT3.2]
MVNKSHSKIADLDNYDLAILEILQQDNIFPQREIADKVNLSAAAVNRRIKRMTDNGVIKSNIAVIDPDKVGQFITIIVNVEFLNEQIELIDEAKRKFSSFPQVQQCYYVTGEIDFILVINVPTMANYEALTRQLFFNDSNIKRFRTFVAMDRVKVGLAIPVNGNSILK